MIGVGRTLYNNPRLSGREIATEPGAICHNRVGFCGNSTTVGGEEQIAVSVGNGGAPFLCYQGANGGRGRIGGEGHTGILSEVPIATGTKLLRHTVVSE